MSGVVVAEATRCVPFTFKIPVATGPTGLQAGAMACCAGVPALPSLPAPKLSTAHSLHCTSPLPQVRRPGVRCGGAPSQPAAAGVIGSGRVLLPTRWLPAGTVPHSAHFAAPCGRALHAPAARHQPAAVPAGGARPGCPGWFGNKGYFCWWGRMPVAQRVQARCAECPPIALQAA